jgi:hypothetical protein
MKRLPILTGLVLAGILFIVPAAHAQQEVSLTVDGFNGFPWGTSADSLVEALGEPVQADTLDGRMLVLAYLDSLEATSTVAMYAVLEADGLVKGQHTISFDELLSTGDCEEQFIRLRSYLLLKYPMIVPEDRSRNDSPKPFCEAVVDGDAAWLSTWNDSTTGARAMVVIDAGRPRLNVVFESARFIEWVESREAESTP